MSLAAFLIHTCTIQRVAVIAVDPYGSSDPTWADLAYDVPCRLIEQTDVLIATERVAGSFAVRYKLLVGPETDLLPTDRIYIEGKPTFTILQVLDKNGRAGLHHRQALLWVIE